MSSSSFSDPTLCPFLCPSPLFSPLPLPSVPPLCSSLLPFPSAPPLPLPCQFILVGDHFQLPPLVQSQEARWGTHARTHARTHTHTHTHTPTYTHNENVFLYTLLTRMHTHQVTHQTASLPNVNHPLLHTDSFKFKINHRLCNFVTMATTKWPTNSYLANRLSI